MQSVCLWPHVHNLEQDAVGALEHHLVVRPLGAAELGVVARCPEQRRHAPLGQPGHRRVDIRLRRDLQRQVVHARAVVVVEHVPGRRAKPQAGLVLIANAQYILAVVERLQAGEGQQILVERQVGGLNVELDMTDFALHRFFFLDSVCPATKRPQAAILEISISDYTVPSVVAPQSTVESLFDWMNDPRLSVMFNKLMQIERFGS